MREMKLDFLQASVDKRKIAVVPLDKAISAIVDREYNENMTGDFSQNAVMLPGGKEITTYSKTTDAFFVLERLRDDYGFAVDPNDAKEYILQRNTKAEADDYDWFESNEGGFRYVLAVEFESKEIPLGENDRVLGGDEVKFLLSREY